MLTFILKVEQTQRISFFKLIALNVIVKSISNTTFDHITQPYLM